MAKAVLTTKVDPSYDDLPEERYHFPRTYLNAVRQSLLRRDRVLRASTCQRGTVEQWRATIAFRDGAGAVMRLVNMRGEAADDRRRGGIGRIGGFWSLIGRGSFKFKGVRGGGAGRSVRSSCGCWTTLGT